jgi:hypothetical protein
MAFTLDLTKRNFALLGTFLISVVILIVAYSTPTFKSACSGLKFPGAGWAYEASLRIDFFSNTEQELRR